MKARGILRTITVDKKNWLGSPSANWRAIIVDTEFLFLKAQSFYRDGNYIESEAFCRQVLGANPLHSEATLLFALNSDQRGHTSIALTYLRNLLKRDPYSAEAHIAISRVLFRSEKLDEAQKHGVLGIGLSPDNVEGYIVVARGLVLNGMSEECSSLLDKAIDSHEEDAEFCRRMAVALISVGLSGEAIGAASRLVALRPDDATGWLLLAKAYLAKDQLKEAIEFGRKAVERDDNLAEAHVVLASALNDYGLISEAQLHFERVIELRPEESEAYNATAVILQQKGDFEKAKLVLEKSIELNPLNGYAYFSLVESKSVTEEIEPLLEKLENFASNQNSNLLDRSYLNFTIAKCRENLGDYEGAMSAYDAANESAYKHWFASRVWDQSKFARYFENWFETFTPELCNRLKGQGSQSQLPVFIVGMPRSGTTLVEQIISSHEDVSAGGELGFWIDQSAKAFNVKTGVFDHSKLHQITGDYLEQLTEIGPHSTRVTDKMPHNFFVLGLLSLSFQNLRVIHVRRNAVDNCLSIYTTPFGKPPFYAMRREDISFTYRQYQRIMSHWRTILGPEQLLEVDYEDLVANSETVARRMIEFVGLPWSEACLHPELNKRAVQTVNMWQVRQPVYKTSIDRWLKYRPWLGEFEDLLEKRHGEFKLL